MYILEPRSVMASPTDNLFNETAMNNSKVKFGAPHVVDLGQELQYSPDGKVTHLQCRGCGWKN